MNLLFFSPIENNLFTIYFFSFIVGFLFGSIPFGYLIAKMRRIDIRNHGSKNIGFNNVRRVLGIKYAIPVLIFDIAKGFVPTFFAHQLGAIGIITGLGAILGHNYSPWLSFQGGKGVATTIGVMLALIPYAVLCGLGVFIITALFFSYISLASLTFAITLPIAVIIFYPGEKLLISLTVISVILIVIRHKSNILRIIKKTEPKIQTDKLLG